MSRFSRPRIRWRLPRSFVSEGSGVAGAALALAAAAPGGDVPVCPGSPAPTYESVWTGRVLPVPVCDDTGFSVPLRVGIWPFIRDILPFPSEWPDSPPIS